MNFRKGKEATSTIGLSQVENGLKRYNFRFTGIREILKIR